MKPKILVIFGNIAYYGQERITVEIFRRLQTQTEILFLTHYKWAGLHILPELEKYGFKYAPLRFMAPFRKHHKLKNWLRNISRFFTGNYDLIKYLRKFKPDRIYCANDFFCMQLLPALLIYRKIPIVFYAMDKPLSHYGLYRFLWKKFLSKRINRFWAISEFIEQELIKAGVKKQKITVNYPPVQKRIIQKHIDLPKTRKFRITYIGQIIPEKGVELLLEAALMMLEKRNDIEFVFAGDHNTDYGQYLINKIPGQFRNNIKFAGYVEDIYGLLKSTDVLVVPSLKEEPLGIVVLEAKQFGVPAVVFPSGGLPEMIEHKTDGFICEEKTSDSLVKGIEFLINKKNNPKIIVKSLQKYEYKLDNCLYNNSD